MTGGGAIQIVVCAGGLGTRVSGWSRYIPKEYYPVGGRPGIVHLLDEIARSGPADIVIVCHPYYEAFTSWARTVVVPPRPPAHTTTWMAPLPVTAAAGAVG